MARPKKAKALERLRRLLGEIPELKNLRHGSPEFKKWRRNAEVAIANTFGDESSHIGEFRAINYSPQVDFSGIPGVPAPNFQAKYLRDLESTASLLESMIEEIEDYWEDENQTPTPIHSEIHETERINTNEVFIVHGRDESAQNEVARFIAKLGLVPVILHEQANLGRTIIEKFEEHAQVGFAMALLTPDDVGALKDEENNLNPRARQNVIFEFGYFIGRLGRQKVCALTKGNVEIPSDYSGVLYIRLDDAGGWKMKLITELKSAGLDVNTKKAL